MLLSRYLPEILIRDEKKKKNLTLFDYMNKNSQIKNIYIYISQNIITYKGPIKICNKITEHLEIENEEYLEMFYILSAKGTIK